MCQQPVNTTPIDPVPADHEALDSLRARGDLGGGELVLRTVDGTEISLPSSLLRLVVSAASNLAAGRAVMTIPSELLPQSRHRRIRLEDVLAFQHRRERALALEVVRN
jgi:hypothetical protein